MHLLEIVLEASAHFLGEILHPQKASKRTYAIRSLLILAILLLLLTPLYFFAF